MKKSIYTLLIAFSVLASTTFSAFAQDQGTAEEAKAMVERALVALKENGEEATFKAINDPNNPTFHDRDLYVFVISTDEKGTFLAHGLKPLLIGKDLINLKDVKGTPLVQNFINKVKNDGEGWVDYHWPHPITKRTAAKSSFVKKATDTYLVGVGIYK